MNVKKILTIAILSLVCLPTTLRAETINVPRESVSNSLVDIVENTLIAKEYKYDNSRKSEGILFFTLTCENTKTKVFFKCNEKLQTVKLMTVLPNNIPSNKRNIIAKFITRCNYALNLGNYDMDFSDGEVRFKYAIDVEEGCLSPKMVENMLYVSAKMINDAQPYIMKICYGDMSPEEAYEQWKKD